LYKGATPPAVAWAAIDSVLLGFTVQLPVDSPSSWNDGANSWRRRRAPVASGAWYRRIRCWANEVRIMDVLIEVTNETLAARWLPLQWNF